MPPQIDENAENGFDEGNHLPIIYLIYSLFFVFSLHVYLFNYLSIYHLSAVNKVTYLFTEGQNGESSDEDEEDEDDDEDDEDFQSNSTLSQMLQKLVDLGKLRI